MLERERATGGGGEYFCLLCGGNKVTTNLQNYEHLVCHLPEVCREMFLTAEFGILHFNSGLDQTESSELQRDTICLYFRNAEAVGRVSSRY